MLLSYVYGFQLIRLHLPCAHDFAIVGDFAEGSIFCALSGLTVFPSDTAPKGQISPG